MTRISPLLCALVLGLSAGPALAQSGSADTILDPPAAATDPGPAERTPRYDPRTAAPQGDADTGAEKDGEPAPVPLASMPVLPQTPVQGPASYEDRNSFFDAMLPIF